MDTERRKHQFELHELGVPPGEEVGEDVAEMKGGNAADKRDMLRLGKTQELRVRRR